MNKELADLLFPNITTTPEELEAKYPKRNLPEGAMVTRLGPSPTGFIHVGNLLGAFISSVYAKQSGGVFYLRLEDTDSKREIDGAKEAILDALEEFNIDYDEGYGKSGEYGPYIQSERVNIYHTYVKKMIEDGNAYPCFMTEKEIVRIREEQEIDKLRVGIYGHYALDRNLSLEEIKEKINRGEEYVIRLKSLGNINNEVILHDAIKGDITMPENDQDIPLLKKDGVPTYHFAHVVDDHLMRTTHVIRGDEWVSSYPRHEQLTKLLGFELPTYAHIAPLTKKEDGNIRKLSKRKDPEFAVSYYAQTGIPIEAFHLYLATITNTNFEEWYNENIDKNISDFQFTFDKMPVGGTLFDLDKLTNIAKTYLSRQSAEEIYQNTLIFTEKFDPEFYSLLLKNKDIMIKFLNIEKDGPRPRKDIASYKDVKNEFRYAVDELFMKDNYKELDSTKQYDLKLLDEYFKIYSETDTKEEWFHRVKEFASNHGYAAQVKEYKKNPDDYKGHVGDVCQMIRVCVTGREQTPDLYSILNVLGKDKIKQRFELFHKKFQ